MKHKLLLVTPPFTQLNTPYPATAYIKGFLNTQNIASTQIDLGIETILDLFSKEQLINLFKIDFEDLNNFSQNANRIYLLREDYINAIGPVIQFLQDQDPTLAHLICERNFLPEASKFEQLEELDWAFGTMGIRDQARHLATLFLEDISDFIVEVVDENFGFSRYAERLGMSANSFDELYEGLNQPKSFIVSRMLKLLQQEIENNQPTLICLSIPFPGNLYAGLTCGQFIKQNYPNIKVVMGGGYPNTELRSLSDARVFEFVDFITLDDGETPLMTLLSYLEGDIEVEYLKRAFTLINEEVIYCNGSINPDVKQEVVGTPDYSDLPLKKYLSVIQLTNPMHRLWSDGRWNKLTMAHGCYWGKCTFCDISLDYIKNYEASSAQLIVDRMEELVAQTGERGFHFVDEAAPPALMKAVAIEILKRNLIVTWWTNIRFEKSFTADLCRLLAASGCIAVSGGLEVASDRLLKLISKGVSIEQVAKVNYHFNQAGIMVHAYLMYGFPTETDLETVNSLEVVRQMFEIGVMQSAFWHRFAMTAHSPVGIAPADFAVVNQTKVGAFANNDLVHTDPTGGNHDLFGEGLKKSLYNYMHGVCLDYNLQEWFDHKIPRTTLPKNLIANYLDSIEDSPIKPNQKLIWIGGAVNYNNEERLLEIFTKQDDYAIECERKIGQWFAEFLPKCIPNSGKTITILILEKEYVNAGLLNFDQFINKSELFDALREVGLLLV